MTTPQEQPIPYYLRPNDHQKQLNEKMTQLFPEMDRTLVQTPMARSKWYQPNETIEDSEEPCFIAAPIRHKQDPKDYIWMPKCKDLDAGYYHLKTQEAYIQLYKLARKQRPSFIKSRLFGNKQTKADYKLHKQVEDLLYLRLTAKEPHDVHAQRDQVWKLQSDANKAQAFGKASYLPVLTTAILI